jgi:nitrous oxidase accessory protein
MNVPSTEHNVALAALLVCALFVLAAAASGAQADSTAVDAQTPGEYDFELPEKDGTATVEGKTYDSLTAALEAADPNSTVRLAGRFNETVVVETPNITLAGEGPEETVFSGSGEGNVLTIDAPNVTVSGVWVHNGGYNTS